MIDEFEAKKDALPRHIIFAESITDVSKIYSIFRKRIGIDKSETYEMFHSKTVEGKKEQIISDMIKEGKIRILICTNSAGMGVISMGFIMVFTMAFQERWILWFSRWVEQEGTVNHHMN